MGPRRLWQTLQGWPAERWALLLDLGAALLPVFRSDGHLLSSDAAYYFSYLRSAVLDRDLDVRNDIALASDRSADSRLSRVCR